MKQTLFKPTGVRFPSRTILPIFIGICLLFQSCSTVRVKEVPMLVTKEGIASSRLLRSLAPAQAPELAPFAQSSIDLLTSARKLEQRGKTQEATVCYLRTALDARELLITRDKAKTAETEDELLQIHNHSLARFAELWSTDPRRGVENRLRFQAEGESFEVYIPESSDYGHMYFDRAVAAESLKGDGVVERNREGYGAAMVGIRDQAEDRAEELQFFSKRGMHVPISLVIENPSKSGQTTIVPISIKNPMLTETVLVGGRSVPLAANFSGFMELLLKGRNDFIWGMKGFFKADERIKDSGIYLLEPFDPDRIPVILTHGLVSVPIIWRDLIPELLAEPDISSKYQFMVFSYPSSYILPESALLFRNELADLREMYDPKGTTPLSNNMVAMGHSMGGMLTHLLAKDMGDNLWKEVSDVPLEETDASEEEKERARELVYFRADPAVRRLVFMSAPHGGAKAADLSIANALSRLAKLPTDVLQVAADTITLSNLENTNIKYGKKVTSVQSLSPESPVVKAMKKTPYKEGVVYHSIIGDRGKGDTPDSSDGVVEYWSSHQPGAASEVIVPTGHSSYTHPDAVAEIKRVLREHAGLR